MNLEDPTRAVASSLDVGVLAALSAAGRPLTASEIASDAARGSEVGVRRSIDRLVRQGSVIATQMGRNRVHVLNRDHLVAPVADLLTGLRLELWRRMRTTMGSWDPKPLYACVFGSAARGDGDEDSDIDVLVVRPMFAHEPFPDVRGGLAASMIVRLRDGVVPAAHEEQWQRQIDAFDDQVFRWTGNRAHVVEMTASRWLGAQHEDSALRESIADDAIHLAGNPDPTLRDSQV